MKIPLIIAHRGESYDAPENTMAAINLAWERGAEAVEIDVQLSEDNEVVGFHDFNTKRVAGVNEKIAVQNLGELKQLDVGTWKDIKWKGEKIPLLREVLNTVPSWGKLIVEVKSGIETIQCIKQELEASNLQAQQVEFIGFELATMFQTKRALPQNRVLWLLDLDYYWYTRIFHPSISKAIAKAKMHQLDGLNVWAGKMLDKSMIHTVHDAGLLLYCWTVDDIEHAAKLIDWGIDGITTNRAAWMKEEFSLSK
jgi:glycerophosphoryl diester phosphodiesterase